ncbi:MAG: histidine kinase dimerization/phosphoacceptor domain -containing protein [Haliscomenobacter sp.]|uniref:tetratricopeptide repeat-containing sensor histidine kinase n=1 Tax=Haliscomenobacter sp. TaxID=2717303 RepID=UPI0029B0BEB0|nr:histidine kinase dimerization/phosphoacceptor domain -containing protein [Haliscomenobacter sp.]MDX2071079.1 histidine kinase dimerization/phosphoacceptor domain -containing protein [Haliscomenobacter sp.]
MINNMAKYFLFLICCIGFFGLPAQSRLDPLLNLDPIFSVAFDSLNAGRHQATISLLNQAKKQYKEQTQLLKYTGALIMLGKVYADLQQFDSTLIFLNEALRITQNIGHEKIAANIEEGLARVYLQKKNYPLAKKHYYHFAAWCFREGKPKAKVQTCLQLVQIYTRAVEPDSTLKYLRKGLSFAKGHDFPVLQYKLNQMSGLSHNNQNHADSALYYFHQSLALLEKSGHTERSVNVYLNITHVFLEHHNTQRARKYLDMARRNAQGNSPGFIAAMIKHYEGRVLAAEKKYPEAINAMNKAHAAFEKLPDAHKHPLMQARCLKALAEVYHEMGEDEKALEKLRLSKAMDVKVFKRYNEMQTELLEAAILSEQDAIDASDDLLMENLIWAQKSENFSTQIKLYETLAANARKKKNTEQALAYLEKVRLLEDQLDPVLQANKLNELESKTQDESIKSLQVTNIQNTRQLKSTRIKAILLISVLLLFASIALWLYRRKKQQAAQIQLEKQQIETSLQEKELLLKEIHHRVKNNMQVISSLLNLQSKGVQDPVALKVMRDGRDRVRSMALIHQTLYQNNDFSNVATADYFHKLAENLFHTYNIDQQRVQLVSQIQPLKFNVDIMIALGLILNELISNTLKYAFPNEQSGEVRISLSANADQVELKVEDNGIGFPANFAPDTSRSIGFSLINAFTQKLGGSLQLNNAEGGARASLIFPINNATLAA